MVKGERICREIAGHEFREGGRLTASLGAACMGDSGDDIQAEAEAALARAISEGGNRCLALQPIPTPPAPPRPSPSAGNDGPTGRVSLERDPESA